jgi:hypothetical protein
VEPNGYSFVPFLVETYGRLDQLAMKLLHVQGDEAACPDKVSRVSFERIAEIGKRASV